MLPTRMTYDVAKHRHQERLDHAARIHEIRQARRDGTLDVVDRPARRRFTAARLAAALTTLRASLHF